MASSIRFPPVVMEVAPGTPRDWTVLIFLHIPKTAGLNLRHIINYQYGLADVCAPEAGTDPRRTDLFRYVETGKPLRNRGPGFDPNAQFRRVFRERCAGVGGLRAIFGHVWYGFHEDVPGPSTYLTVLRDPVERALSVYFHRVSRHGLRVDLERWVEKARDFELDNSQTRRLCGALPDTDVRFEPCNGDMLNRAKAHLRDRFSVVGIAERFDESLLLMSRTYGWRLRSYDVYNVNRKRPRGRAIPDSIRQAIAGHNRYDIQLYEYGRTLFEQQLDAADPPIDGEAIRRFRRNNRLRRYISRRRIYPVARPLVRGSRALRRGARRILPGRSS